MEQRRIDEIGTVFNGKTPSKADQRHEGFPVLKIKDVDAGGRFRGNFESFVDTAFADKFKSKQLAFGDTLILNAAHNADYVGSKTFFASESLGGPVITGEWTVVRPDPVKADPRYVRHYLESGRARHSLRQMVKGIHLYPKDVARCGIPLPPLPEQRRIAEILDKADALRQKRREAIAKLDQLLQSVFLDMFGALEPEGDVVEDLAKAAKGSMRTGPFGSQLLHSEFVESGISVLGIDNAVHNEFRWAGSRFINEQKFHSLRRFQVWPGDVLITIMGTCGRCAVVPDDVPRAINTKHLCCITLDQEKCLPEFLHSYFLIHPAARRYLTSAAKGAIMSGLNMGIIKKLPVPRVKIAEQENFVRAKCRIGDTIALHRRQLASMDGLCSSLQQRAFTGQL